MSTLWIVNFGNLKDRVVGNTDLVQLLNVNRVEGNVRVSPP